jgi:hypothetical protein
MEKSMRLDPRTTAGASHQQYDVPQRTVAKRPKHQYDDSAIIVQLKISNAQPIHIPLLPVERPG